MQYRFLFLALILWIPYRSPLVENTFLQDDVLNKIEILSEGKSPGVVVAIKLKKTYTNSRTQICISGECLKLTNQWQLIATKVDGADRPPVLIEEVNSGWLLSFLQLEKNLFQLRAPAKLRLPSSVRAKIENRDEEIEKERLYNSQMLKTYSQKNWPCQWRYPIAPDISSQFGSARTLPTGQVYSHKGLDLRAPVGRKVSSVADGVVLSVDEQIVGGNTINIDHGKGVISRYLHLSKFSVQKGDEVKAGQLIGRSGASGRVEAPHLHWEMRLRGTPVEPASTLLLMSQLCGRE